MFPQVLDLQEGLRLSVCERDLKLQNTVKVTIVLQFIVSQLVFPKSTGGNNGLEFLNVKKCLGW